MKLLALLPFLAASAFAAPPANGLPQPAADAIERAFRQLAIAERDALPKRAQATERSDLAFLAHLVSTFASTVRRVAADDLLPAAFRNELDFLSEGLEGESEGCRGLVRDRSLHVETADDEWLPVIEAAETAAVWAQVRLLAFARDAGAGEAGVQLAPYWANAVAVLCGDRDLPPLAPEARYLRPALRDRVRALAADPAAVPRRPNRYRPRGTPDALAVSKAVARIAEIEGSLQANFASAPPSADLVRATRLMDESVAALRKVDAKACSAPFREAFANYGRGRVGIVSVLKGATGKGEAADVASTVAELSRRSALQVADKAEIVRQARRAGADTEPLFPVWPDAFAYVALVRPAAPQPPAAARKDTPAQRYADELSRHAKAFAESCTRAPAGAGGAKARLAALRAFHGKAGALDVSGLPADVRSAHAALLAEMKKNVDFGREIADLLGKGPAGMAVAMERVQRSESGLMASLQAAADRLKAALRRAGADVSALDFGD